MPRRKSESLHPEAEIDVTLRRPIVMPEGYVIGSSWDEYVLKFELIAKLNGWVKSDIRSQFLALGLTGNLLNFYSGLPDAIKSDYNSLVKSLGEFVNPAEARELKKVLFQGRKQERGESLYDFSVVLTRLGKEAYPRADPAMIEELILDQFTRGIGDPELRRLVRQSRNKTISGALHCALELQTAMQLEGEVRMQGVVDSDNLPSGSGVNQVSADAKFYKISEKQSGEIKQLKPFVTDLGKHVGKNYKEAMSDLIISQNEKIDKLERSVVALTNSLNELKYDKTGVQARSRMGCWNCGLLGHRKSECRRKQAVNGVRSRRGLPTSTGRVLVPSVGKQGSVLLKSKLSTFINNLKLEVLVDTGAMVSLIGRKVYDKLGLKLEEKSGPNNIVSANGQSINCYGIVNVEVRIGSSRYKENLIVADIEETCILGVDFLFKHKAVISFAESTICLKNETFKLGEQTFNGSSGDNSVYLSESVTVPGNHEVVVWGKINKMGGLMKGQDCIVENCFQNSTRTGLWVAGSLVAANAECSDIPVRILNLSDRESKLEKGTKVAEACMLVQGKLERLEKNGGRKEETKEVCDLFNLSNSDLDEKETARLKTLLNEFSDIVSLGSHDLGKTELAQHHINTGFSKPIKQGVRRVPMHLKEKVRLMVKEMEKEGVIEASESPWCSPIVLVKKKDGSLRFCVDFRKLNNVTIKDAYPLPRIGDMLDYLAGARFFSTLDMASGYWQVSMDDKDKEKTAFSTGEGLYHFKVMPFGLCNAPGTYQRLMNMVLAGLQWQTCLVYLDDVIIWSSTVEEHFLRVRAVFEKIRAAKLKLKPSKCCLFRNKIVFLGHQITKDGISVDPDKIKAVLSWPVPTCQTELKAFLGFASYYRKFIKGFSEIVEPLNRAVIKGKSKVVFDKNMVESFGLIKQKLTSTPVLSLPGDGGKYIVDTDASDVGLGIVLSQIQDGQEKVIAYGSRTLKKSERKYCATRKELLAVVYGLKHFRYFLLGSQFTVRTDHRSLKWLTSFKEPEGQVARWLECLAEYDFEVVHRPGKLHCNADGLSRSCRQCGGNKEVEASREMVAEINFREASALEKEIKENQSADKDLKQVLEWLTHGKPTFEEIKGKGRRLVSLWTQFDRICLKDGLLCRLYYNYNRDDTYQVLTPKSLTECVLKFYHESEQGGHLGVEKTVSKLKNRFYWPGFHSDVEIWVRSCQKCQEKRPGKNRGPLQTSSTGFPFQRVAMDILGPLPQAEDGSKYILIVSDYFTRWTEAYSLPNIEAKTVARVFLEEYVCRYGSPMELHTDQGRQFECAIFRELCSQLDIWKTRTTPYHPQSDGQVERFNKTLCHMLSKVVNESQTDWHEKLPWVLSAYRTSRHEATKFSPYFALFGCEMRYPIDSLLPPGEEEERLPEYIRKVRGKLAYAHDIIRTNQEGAQDRQKNLYDRKSKGAPFREGELVLMWNPAIKKKQSSKLHRPWEGPYKIIKKIGDVTYQLRDERNRHARRVVHFDRLKRYMVAPGGEAVSLKRK